MKIGKIFVVGVNWHPKHFQSDDKKSPLYNIPWNSLSIRLPFWMIVVVIALIFHHIGVPDISNAQIISDIRSIKIHPRFPHNVTRLNVTTHYNQSNFKRSQQPAIILNKQRISNLEIDNLTLKIDGFDRRINNDGRDGDLKLLEIDNPTLKIDGFDRRINNDGRNGDLKLLEIDNITLKIDEFDRRIHNDGRNGDLKLLSSLGSHSENQNIKETDYESNRDRYFSGLGHSQGQQGVLNQTLWARDQFVNGQSGVKFDDHIRTGKGVDSSQQIYELTLGEKRDRQGTKIDDLDNTYFLLRSRGNSTITAVLASGGGGNLNNKSAAFLSGRRQNQQSSEGTHSFKLRKQEQQAAVLSSATEFSRINHQGNYKLKEYEFRDRGDTSRYRVQQLGEGGGIGGGFQTVLLNDSSLLQELGGRNEGGNGEAQSGKSNPNNGISYIFSNNYRQTEDEAGRKRVVYASQYKEGYVNRFVNRNEVKVLPLPTKRPPPYDFGYDDVNQNPIPDILIPETGKQKTELQFLPGEKPVLSETRKSSNASYPIKGIGSIDFKYRPFNPGFLLETTAQDTTRPNVSSQPTTESLGRNWSEGRDLQYGAGTLKSIIEELTIATGQERIANPTPRLAFISPLGNNEHRSSASVYHEGVPESRNSTYLRVVTSTTLEKSDFNTVVSIDKVEQANKFTFGIDDDLPSAIGHAGTVDQDEDSRISTTRIFYYPEDYDYSNNFTSPADVNVNYLDVVIPKGATVVSRQRNISKINYESKNYTVTRFGIPQSISLGFYNKTAFYTPTGSFEGYTDDKGVRLSYYPTFNDIVTNGISPGSKEKAGTGISAEYSSQSHVELKKTLTTGGSPTINDVFHGTKFLEKDYSTISSNTGQPNLEAIITRFNETESKQDYEDEIITDSTFLPNPTPPGAKRIFYSSITEWYDSSSSSSSNSTTPSYKGSVDNVAANASEDQKYYALIDEVGSDRGVSILQNKSIIPSDRGPKIEYITDDYDSTGFSYLSRPPPEPITPLSNLVEPRTSYSFDTAPKISLSSSSSGTSKTVTVKDDGAIGFVTPVRVGGSGVEIIDREKTTRPEIFGDINLGSAQQSSDVIRPTPPLPLREHEVEIPKGGEEQEEEEEEENGKGNLYGPLGEGDRDTIIRPFTQDLFGGPIATIESISTVKSTQPPHADIETDISQLRTSTSFPRRRLPLLQPTLDKSDEARNVQVFQRPSEGPISSTISPKPGISFTENRFGLRDRFVTHLPPAPRPFIFEQRGTPTRVTATDHAFGRIEQSAHHTPGRIPSFITNFPGQESHPFFFGSDEDHSIAYDEFPVPTTRLPISEGDLPRLEGPIREIPSFRRQEIVQRPNELPPNLKLPFTPGDLLFLETDFRESRIFTPQIRQSTVGSVFEGHRQAVSVQPFATRSPLIPGVRRIQNEIRRIPGIQIGPPEPRHPLIQEFTRRTLPPRQPSQVSRFNFPSRGDSQTLLNPRPGVFLVTRQPSPFLPNPQSSRPIFPFQSTRIEQRPPFVPGQSRVGGDTAQVPPGPMDMDMWQCEFDTMALNHLRKVDFACPTNLPDEGGRRYPVANKKCLWYIVCSNGHPWYMCCAAGTRFNPTTQDCEYPDQFNCND